MKPEADWDLTALPEGTAVLAAHTRRERRPVLVKMKKVLTLHEKGRLDCEVCRFNFEAKYGELGGDFIECHHIVPLSEADPERKTKLCDLALVCANCHRVLHRTGVPIAVLRDSISMRDSAQGD